MTAPDRWERLRAEAAGLKAALVMLALSLAAGYLVWLVAAMAVSVEGGWVLPLALAGVGVAVGVAIRLSGPGSGGAR